MPNVPGNPAPQRPDIPDFWYDLAIAGMIESGRLKDPDTLLTIPRGYDTLHVTPGGIVEYEKRRKGGIDKAIQEKYRTENEERSLPAPELLEAEPFRTDQLAPGYRR